MSSMHFTRIGLLALCASGIPLLVACGAGDPRAAAGAPLTVSTVQVAPKPLPLVIETVGRAEGWSDEILRKNTDTTETQRAGFRKAVAAGVNIAYGTDSGVYPHGDNARQFAYMVRYGMTPMQAIQSATIQPARMLGREGELGSIAPGKFADLIAVDGDPLADIDVLRDVRSVIKNGKRVCDGPEECGPPRQDTYDGK